MTVRVRFAGAPSGDIHIGNMRTVLFNHLFAKHEGGAFIWRVEDTDKQRADASLIARAMETLSWLGIAWDEGPGIGGPHEPYWQSQRVDSHLAAIAKLDAEGHLYRCTCTRDDIKARGVATGYDRHCRYNPPTDDRPYALRFKVPDGRDVVVPDVIRGDVVTPFHEMQDFVVQRSDGSPIFALANTVDDIAMEITHVIRGTDLLNVAASNVLLFEALGAPLPVFAHVPLILGPDKSRLGARHGAVGTLTYRDAGYLPEALFNYLALLGWSHPDGKEVMEPDEIVEHFTIDRINESGAVFDVQKLDWMNQQYMQKLSNEELLQRTLDLFPDVPADTLRAVLDLELIQSRVVRLAEIPDAIRYLHERPETDPQAREKFLTTTEAHQLLPVIADRVEQLEVWASDQIKEVVQATIAELGLHKKRGPKAVFVAIAGTDRALPLFESIFLIGRDEAVARLRAAVR